MVTQAHSIIDDLIDLWPTVCHGFSSEYFGVSAATNIDGAEWLIFRYDYNDEVGYSTYVNLAVPVVKLQQEITRALRTSSRGEVAVPIAAIPVAPQRPGYINDPRVPTIGIGWDLSVVLDPDGRVVACIAAGTRFNRGTPSDLWPRETQHRTLRDKIGLRSLIIDEQSLTAANLPVCSWKAYLP